MKTKEPVQVFVSYAHADKAIQQAFAIRLSAAQKSGSFNYWDDTRLNPGEDWDAVIRQQLDMADIALLLVSTGFLNSSYIKAVEEPTLVDTRRRIFWVQVDDCAWQLSELRHLQRCATLMNLDQVSINAMATKVVVQIAEAAREVRLTRSPVESFMARYLPKHRRYFSNFEEVRIGRHCVVHRAEAELRKDGTREPVVLKILLNNPFENLGVVLKIAAERAKKLGSACFIPLRAHYSDVQFPVLVMQAVSHPPLSDVLKRKGPIRPDLIREQIATLADALTELHRDGGTYGILTPANIFVDEKTGLLRCSALSITGLLSQIRGWQEFLGRNPGAAPYTLPEQFDNQPLSQHSDQYVIGQLALDMLAGSQPDEIETPMELARRVEFFSAPLRRLDADWLQCHPGWQGVLERLLNPNPQKRYPSMNDASRRATPSTAPASSRRFSTSSTGTSATSVPVRRRCSPVPTAGKPAGWRFRPRPCRTPSSRCWWRQRSSKRAWRICGRGTGACPPRTSRCLLTRSSRP